jgi:hypothetical protein
MEKNVGFFEEKSLEGLTPGLFLFRFSIEQINWQPNIKINRRQK